MKNTIEERNANAKGEEDAQHSLHNHKHTWTRGSDEDEDKIYCEKCRVDYDEWVTKMLAKGYNYHELKRFENEN